MVSRWGRILGLSGVCTRMAAQHVCAWKEQEFPLSLAQFPSRRMGPCESTKKDLFCHAKIEPLCRRERARGMLLLKRVWARAVFISRPPGLNYKNIDSRPTFEETPWRSSEMKGRRGAVKKTLVSSLLSVSCVCVTMARTHCAKPTPWVCCVCLIKTRACHALCVASGTAGCQHAEHIRSLLSQTTDLGAPSNCTESAGLNLNNWGWD